MGCLSILSILGILLISSPFQDKSANAQSISVEKIRLDKTSLTISKGFSDTVTFTINEPIICIDSSVECSVVVLLTNPNTNKIAMDNCQVKWTNRDWYKPKFIRVSAVENYINDISINTNIITSPAISNSIYYKGYKSKDIKIQTIPKSSGSCSGSGDPHYYTFDNAYWHVYWPGIYVMYKSLVRDFEVQVITGGYPSQHCGYAAKENNDIVVVYSCDGPLQIRRTCGSDTCNTKGGFPIVSMASSGGSSVITTFASGAIIRIDYYNRYGNMYVTAPGVDNGATSGICGNFNGKPNDDVPIYVATSSSQMFPSQIPTINLFNWYPSTSSMNTPSSTDTHTCSYTPTIILPILGNINAEDITNIIKNTTSVINPNNVVLPTLQPNPNLNYNQSYILCTSSIYSSLSVKTCIANLNNFNITGYITSCSQDLYESGGDTSFISNTIHNIEVDCIKLANSDTSTWQKDENGNLIQPNTDIQNNVCPNQCSTQGICKSGTCVCNTGYKGTDCSINISLPPVITGLSSYLCGDNCDNTIYVYGSSFWNSEQINCRFGNTITRGMYFGSNQVLCTIPIIHQHGSREYTVSLSISLNNGTTWSNSLSYTWYDNICQVCYANSTYHKCTVNPNSCTISDTCYINGQASINNICLRCVPSASSTNWTYVYNSDLCAPHFSTQSYTASIVDIIKKGTRIYTVDARNPLHINDMNYVIKYSINNPFFTIDNLGNIYTAIDIDSNNKPSGFNNLVFITAIDNSGNQAHTQLVVQLISTSRPPFFNQSLYTYYVKETSPIGTIVGDVVANKPLDELNSLTYSWFSAEPGYSEDFRIDTRTGVIKVNKPLDYYEKNEYQIQLMVRDGSGQYSITTISIIILYVNKAPTDIQLSNTMIPENKPPGFVVGKLNSIDRNETHFQYVLLFSSEPYIFYIDNTNLLTNQTFNYESTTNVYTITIRSYDSDGLYYDKSFTITITDINEAPYDISLDSTTFIETHRPNTALTSINVYDDDLGQRVACTLVSSYPGNNNVFIVYGNRLILMNYLTYKTYNITIFCADDGNPIMTTQNNFTINIVSVNQGPTNIKINIPTIMDNTIPGTYIGTVTATDFNPNSTDFNFVVSKETSNYAVNNVSCIKNMQYNTTICTGYIYTTKDINYSNMYNGIDYIKLTAFNNNGETNTNIFSIKILETYILPSYISWVGGQNTIIENSSKGTIIGELLFSGTNIDNNELIIELISPVGVFNLNGRNLTVQTPSLIDFETNPFINVALRVSYNSTTTILYTIVHVIDKPIYSWFNTIGTRQVIILSNTTEGTEVATLITDYVDRDDITTNIQFTVDQYPELFTVNNNSIILNKKIPVNAYNTYILCTATVSFISVNKLQSVSLPNQTKNRLFIEIVQNIDIPIFEYSSYTTSLNDDANIGTTLQLSPNSVFAQTMSNSIVYYAIPTNNGNNKGGIFSINAMTGAIRVTRLPSTRGMGPGEYNLRVSATSNGFTTETVIFINVFDGCSPNPCGSGQCVDTFNGYKCICSNGTITLGSCGDTIPIQFQSNTQNDMANSTLIGIIMSCIILVFIFVFAVYISSRNRNKKIYTETEKSLSNPLYYSSEKEYSSNPLFRSPYEVSITSNYPYTLSDTSFETGMTNPLYDWYCPEMDNKECNEYLSSQADGSFIVRDSKATPGWHILSIRKSNIVVNEKIRVDNEGMYELISSSDKIQPKFSTLPELIRFYTDGFSNPIYDGYDTNSSSTYYYIPDDPDAPELPPKESRIRSFKKPDLDANV